MFYLPPGSMMQLMDGRVLHKDQKTNLWHDNLGVPITEQQLHFMMSFPSFSDDPSGGGNAPVPVAAASDTVVSLSAPFDDIAAGDASEIQSATKYFSSPIGALTIRLNFSNGTYNGTNGSLLVYKDVGGSVTLIDTISVSSRPTQDGTGLYVLSQTFDDNNGLKFGFLAGDGGNDFNVTVEKTAPEGLVTLDTFNVKANYSS